MLVVFLFIAVQTPWFKQTIAKNVIKNLSLITHSKIEIQSYEGLIPISFDIYKLSFSQNGVIWLTIDRLSLNRTLIRFFFWKNRGIDVSLIHPNLIDLPNIPDQEEAGFQWPRLPFQKLSIHLKTHQVEINPKFAQKPLPQFNAEANLHIKKKGSIFHLASKLDSPELPKVHVLLDVRGFEKNNQIYLKLGLRDLKHQLSEYLFKREIPGFAGEISASGTPESMAAFLHPSKNGIGSFNGTIRGDFVPVDQDFDLVEGFLGEEAIHLFSQFYFEDQTGLSLKQFELEGPNVSLKGIGHLTRNYIFEKTELKGEISHLDFLFPWTQALIEGKVETQVELFGPYLNPKIIAGFTSNYLESGKYLGEKVIGKISLERVEDQFQGALTLKAMLNQNPCSFSSDFSLFNSGQFALKDLNLEYGQNQITSSFFKTSEEGYQGLLEFNLGNLALFSPLVNYALHGSAQGEISLDLDGSQDMPDQKVDLTAQGDSFQVTKLELKEYFFHAQGALNLKDYTSFEGDLFFQNQAFIWDRYQLDEMQLALSPKNKTSPFQLQSQGYDSMGSSGQLTYNQENLTLFVRTLTGNLQGELYTLQRSSTFEISKEKLLFTPIYLKVGIGSLYLSLDPQKEKLETKTEKFPIETLSIFFPKIDVKGYVDLEGSFNHLYSKMRGNLKGSLSQLSIKNNHNMAPYKGQFNLELGRKLLKGTASFNGRNQDAGSIDLSVPLSMNFHPFKIEVNRADRVHMNLEYKGRVNPFLQILLPQNHLLEGNADLAFQLKGPLDHPVVQGSATLEKGHYENLFLGLVLKKISAKIQGKGDQLHLEYFNAEDDLEGNVTAHGTLSTNFNHKMPYQMDLKMNKGKIIQFDFLDATFDGDLYLTGNLDKARLKGDLEILEANVSIPNRIGSTLPTLPVTYLYPKETDCAPSNSKLVPSIPMDFDLHFNVDSTLTLKGRGLDTTWEGDFKILGDDQNPKFEGKLYNKEGSFVFAGKVLTLEEGLIQFDGHLLKGTHINLRGYTSVHNALITAYLKGPILGPKLTFRSDPPYSQTEILSLILFNEPVQKLTPFQAVALTHSLATLGGTYLGPDIVDKVRKGIGVDQLTFGSSIEQGGDYTTIQVGKYITRNVLVTLNRPLTTGTSPFVITAHIKGGWQLQTYFDENELSKIFIQWKLNY